MYHPGNKLLIITVWIWIIVLLRKTKTVNVFHMSPIHGFVSSCTGTQRNETLTNCVDMKTIGIPPCTGTPGQPPFMVCSYNVCWSLIWRYFKVLLLHITASLDTYLIWHLFWRIMSVVHQSGELRITNLLNMPNWMRRVWRWQNIGLDWLSGPWTCTSASFMDMHITFSNVKCSLSMSPLYELMLYVNTGSRPGMLVF